MKSAFIMCFFTTFVLVATQISMAADADHVGIVKSVAGDVLIVRNNSSLKAVTNMNLMILDTVKTGSDGRVGMILEDDTVISMGSNSRITIENFMFQPNEHKLSFIARIFHGTASFISGQIAKLAPHQVHIETPYATIGTRGTQFLVKVDSE